MIELSPQQYKTLDLFLQGLTIKEVALNLGVSYSRAINILNEILVKTGWKSRKELLANGKLLEISIKK